MSALGRAARRLQQVARSHVDGNRSAISVLHLVPESTSPAKASGHAQHQQLHGEAQPIGRASAQWQSSTSGSHSLLQSGTSQQHLSCGGGLAALRLFNMPSASRSSAPTLRSFSAFTAQAGSIAWPSQTLSRQDMAQRRHSSSAAFVTDHGGGVFRTTTAGSASQSASLTTSH